MLSCVAVILTASAPGKVLWAGEYAVLDGAAAIVVAVDRRAIARLDGEAAGTSAFLRAVRDEVARRRGAGSPEVARAERIVVDSSALADAGGRKLGLGSSAAATVAAAAVALGPDAPREFVHAVAHAAHAAAQEPRGSRGSGADVAACVWGGALEVRRRDHAGPLAWSRLPYPTGLHALLIWSGRPADTPALVARVRTFQDRSPADHARLLADMGRAAADLGAAFRADDATAAVTAVDAAGRVLAELAARSGAPLCPPGAAELSAEARELGGAAKPTGAGGGDLLLGVFTDPDAARAFEERAVRRGMTRVPAGVDPEGVRLAETPESA